LVTLRVRSTGERVVPNMRLADEESAASWTEVVASLMTRHLAWPVLAIVDCNPGLMNALRLPEVQHQRARFTKTWQLRCPWWRADGGWRRTVHLSALSVVAVESAPDDERP
jgi:transposase-like protein